MTPKLILFFATLAAIVYLATRYNRLVALRNRLKTCFSQVDVQLRRRYELVPNLIEASKGYLTHEKATLSSVVEARNLASSAAIAASTSPLGKGVIPDLSRADGELSRALSKLFALRESYPDLKASHTIRDLASELSGTENKIASARQEYNAAVEAYNTTREKLPDLILASVLRFLPAQFLETSTPVDRASVKASF